MSSITPTIRPLPKQHLAWEKLQDKTTKYILFGGGNGGGKSWLGAEWLLVMCETYPGTKWFIGRKELKRLMQSSFETFKKVCKYHNIPDNHWKLNGQYNYIEFFNGSRIDLLDVNEVPSDPLFERFGSTEYTGGWLEEAGEIAFGAFEVLKTRVGRWKNKEFDIKPKMLITCNPKKNWLFRDFYKPWKKGQLSPEKAFVRSLYSDNVHTAKEYGEQLSSLRDAVMRQRLRDGVWEYAEDDNALVDFEAITDLWTNHIDDSDDLYLSADIARLGVDKTVVGIWQGFDLKVILTREQQRTNTTTTWIDGLLRTYRIPRSRCVIDEDGVGGGVVDNLPGTKGFVANSSPLLEGSKARQFKTTGQTESIFIRNNFFNLKAQCAWKLADKILDREVHITSSDEKVKEMIEEELAATLRKKDVDSEGKLQLIPKEKVKEDIGRSPDFADMMIMRMMFELRGQKGFTPPKLTPVEREFMEMKRMKRPTLSNKLQRL